MGEVDQAGRVLRLLRTTAAAANAATTVETVAQVCLDAIYEYCGLPVGHLFVTRPNDSTTLVSSGVWHLEDAERFDDFRQVSEALQLPAGVGLAGTVLASGQPAWLRDLGAETMLPRAESAMAAGLRGVFAFPVRAGTEAGHLEAVGVLEFFSTEVGEPDVALLDVMNQVGSHLGRVVERTRAAEALKSSEQRLRLVLQTAGEAFVAMDAGGTITEWNATAESTFGWARDDALGRRLVETIVPERYRQAHERGLAHYLATGEGPVLGQRLELEARHADGHEFPIELSIWSVPWGGSVEFNAFVRDISERRIAELALEDAKSAAETATAAMSAFLATMSHEIRTPLSAIIGMTGLLLETPLTSEQQDFASTIRTSGDGLLEIINDVLDFSKIEAGELDFEGQPLSVQDCVESAFDLVAPQAATKGLELVHVSADDCPAAIVGDVTRLRQILVNLLNNAVKFTETGHVLLTVSAGELGADRVELHFAVTDTGMGVPPERMDRLFESFRQGDASTAGTHGGTGLGLAISRRLVEAMGGSMWAESEPGRGSTFRFTIVAAVAADVVRPAPVAHLQGRRALLVDDNDTNLEILSRQVGSWGMDSAATADAATALEWLAAGERFDVAVVDQQMPDMDGVALARVIVGLGTHPDLPLVLLTSLGHHDVPEGLFAATLVKPAKAALLHAALERALNGADASEQSGAERTSHFGAGDLRILLAEDNMVNQRVGVLLLERLGYRADVAANGQEVLDALDRAPYDVILMDVRMPAMDGLEATRRIRARSDIAQPRIVAMTASAFASDREDCRAAGMDDYVAKPVRWEELVAALARAGATVDVDTDGLTGADGDTA